MAELTKGEIERI